MSSSGELCLFVCHLYCNRNHSCIVYSSHQPIESSMRDNTQSIKHRWYVVLLPAGQCSVQPYQSLCPPSRQLPRDFFANRSCCVAAKSKAACNVSNNVSPSRRSLTFPPLSVPAAGVAAALRQQLHTLLSHVLQLELHCKLITRPYHSHCACVSNINRLYETAGCRSMFSSLALCEEVTVF